MKTLVTKKQITLSLSTLFIALTFVSFTTEAQLPTFLSEDVVETEIAVEYWMTDFNSFLSVEEPELAVEAWMTDVSSFIQITEPEMEVENWMDNVDLFLYEDELLLSNDNETPMEVENWMMDINSFIAQDYKKLASIISLTDVSEITFALNLK